MSRARTPESEGYADLWALWLPIKRKNDGRGDGRKAYAKLLETYTPQDIIDGAQWYIRNLEKGYPYVPMLATWLNREVFADLYERERAYQEQRARVDVMRDAKKRERKERQYPKPKFLQQYENGEFSQ